MLVVSFRICTVRLAEKPWRIPRTRNIVGEDSEGREVRAWDDRGRDVSDGDPVIVEVFLGLVQVVEVLQQCGVQVLVSACCMRTVLTRRAVVGERPSI